MSSAAEIQVVIVNWRRPENIPAIIDAFRRQTAGCAITLCDVGGDEFRLNAATLRSADTSFVWDRNYGSFNRFIPAFAFEGEFCWFHDDDMIPGERMLSHMLSFKHLPFSVLGQSGRRINGQGYRLIRAAEEPKAVDFVCRGYLVRTEFLHHILRFKCEAKLNGDVILDDDILLASAIHAYTGLRAWITSKPSIEAKMNATELPAPYACCDMPGHLSRRKAFFHKCQRISAGIIRPGAGAA